MAYLGLAVSWASLHLHHDLARARTTANNYQLTVYGEYDFNNPFYVNALAAMAYNRYNTLRHISAGSVSLHPRGIYHGLQYSIKGEIGYDHLYQAFHFIPLASLFYSYLDLNSFTETGAGNAGLTVNGQNANMLLGGLGM